MTNSVLVVGAGVIGVLTAYCLAQRGFGVTVLERNKEAALGTSRGNAGIVALGHAEAWGSPSIPQRLVSALVGNNPALKVSKPYDPALWRWGSHFLRESTPSRYRRNTNQLLRLCEYSIEQLRRVGDDEAIEHQRLDRGALYLFRNDVLFQRRVHGIQQDSDALRLLEIKQVDEVVAMDPALAAIGDQLSGAIFSRRDISGDCHVFTQTLAQRLAETGRVNFSFGTSVLEMAVARNKVNAVVTDRGDFTADHVVVAAGNAATPLFKSLGIYVPIYPVKGYSMTFPIRDAHTVPQYPGIDEDQLVSYARYGGRLRVTSVAEFAGSDDSLSEARLAVIENFARTLCADGLDFVSASRWAGFRPATPASAPFLGRLRQVNNLWVNAGHGQLGWSLSAGSAAVVADLIAGRRPAISGISANADWLLAA